ncbi:alpha/beta hydrolase [Nonomuraea ferruginea]|uniref:alpha/beta hydrolase n=1 Tax=Nonomuraea ferruginea TaxID=46174 RepID=UPI00361E0CDD
MTTVTVLAAPGLVADLGLLGELAGREFAALGVAGRVVSPPDTPSFQVALDAAGADGLVVALPGADPEVRGLMDPPRPYASRLVWLDLGVTGPHPAGGATHLYGRGAQGLTWAIRHVVHRAAARPRRVPYGPHPDQYGELHLPGTRPAPVAMLLHGGFYRSIWAADLMDALAADLAARGFAAWNVEYRRPDRHGWAATVSDVAAAYTALSTLPDLDRPLGDRSDLDPARVAVIGHFRRRSARTAPGRRPVAVGTPGPRWPSPSPGCLTWWNATAATSAAARPPWRWAAAAPRSRRSTPDPARWPVSRWAARSSSCRAPRTTRTWWTSTAGTPPRGRTTTSPTWNAPATTST